MTEEIKNLEFDERYDSKEHGTTTLYFTAPKEYLKDFLYEGLEFPEAVSMELSLEYPQNDRQMSISRYLQQMRRARIMTGMMWCYLT